MSWLLVGIGGAAGAMARYGAGVVTNRLIGPPVPYATAMVNILGCAVIGLLAGGADGGHIRMSPEARLFVFVGILGGFTTFSTFGLDTVTLARTQSMTPAVWNVIGQVALGLLAVQAGILLSSK